MKGYATDIDRGFFSDLGVNYELPNAVGVVVAPSFPEPDLIRMALKRGIEKEPADTVWVLRGKPKSNEAGLIALQVFEEVGVEPIFAETNPYWKYRFPSNVDLAGTDRPERRIDDSRVMRDIEMIRCTRLCVVFHDVNSGVTQWFAEKAEQHFQGDRIHLVTRGRLKKKTVHRKGRKPIGE